MSVKALSRRNIVNISRESNADWRKNGRYPCVFTVARQALKLCGGDLGLLLNSLSYAAGDFDLSAGETRPGNPLYTFASTSLTYTAHELYVAQGINPQETMYADLNVFGENGMPGEEFESANYYTSIYYELPDKSAVTVAERDEAFSAIEAGMERYWATQTAQANTAEAIAAFETELIKAVKAQYISTDASSF